MAQFLLDQIPNKNKNYSFRKIKKIRTSKVKGN